jgi:hypothetical protein
MLFSVPMGAQEWMGATRLGGESTDTISGLAVDASGQIYGAGSFVTRITIGTNLFRSHGLDDFFVFKSQPSGEIEWAFSLGGELSDQPRALALDREGNTLVGGGFGGALLLDGQWVVSRGGQDVLLVQVDPTGTVRWHREAGGNGSEEAKGLAVDAQGNAVVTGVFNSSLAYFDSSILTNRGVGDIFIVKYDSQGNVLWIEQAGGTGDDFSSAIASDSEGNLFVTGGFTAPAWFGTNQVSGEAGSMYLAKYDPQGRVVWVKTAGAAAGAFSTGLALDPDGSIYQTGYFLGQVAFDGVILNSAGLYDVFLAKYSPEGSVIWARRAGGISMDQAGGVSVDAEGHATLTGYFIGEADFGSQTVRSLCKSLFVAQYDAAGNALWVLPPTQGLACEGKLVVPTDAGQWLLGGEFSGSIGLGSTNLASQGERDVLLARINATACPASVQPRPLSLMKVSPAEFVITAQVDPGHEFEIQATADFHQWSVLTNFTAGTNTFTLVDRPPAGVSYRFYRNVRICR